GFLLARSLVHSLGPTLTRLVDDLGLHDVVVALGATGPGAAARAGRARRARLGERLPAGTRGLLGLGVQRAADLLRDPGDLLLRGLHRADVAAAQRRPQLGQGVGQLSLLLLRDLVAVLREELLGLVLQGLGQVA